MIKKLTALILTAVMMCLFVSCSNGSGEGGSEMGLDPKTAESVDLSILPEKCDLILFEKFKEGFATVANTNWEEHPATLKEIQKAFGSKGEYFAKCDVIENNTVYKTYVWYSEEDWIHGKIAVAVTFRVDDETGEQIYYSYVSQGIDYTDVQ